MTFLDQPVPPRIAMDFLARKNIVPSQMTTAEWQKVDAAIRQQSFYSATNYFEDVLAELRDRVSAAISGESFDLGSARLAVKEALREAGYQPGEGEAGTIRDLSSDARINLVVNTNREMAQGFGYLVQGNDPAIIDAFPALELIRIEDRKVPRDVGPLGWAKRWQMAGGKMFDGRMIALKDDAVWDKIGSTELFDDGLDNPYPPFAFNSGMDVREISRDEAITLGVMTPDTQVEPRELEFGVSE